MACVYCNIEFHELCPICQEDGNCCCNGEGYKPDLVFAGLDTRKKRSRLDGSMLNDPTSTGRHRAAVRIPEEYFATDPICSWTGLAAAGGGVRPIIGCLGNVATDRHHGPDKSVLNNDDDLEYFGVNLHAICRWCHARWHAQNDPYYKPPGWKKGDGDGRPENGAPWLPVGHECLAHDPDTKADINLIKLHEKWWNLHPEERIEMGNDFYESAIYPGRSEPADSESSVTSGPFGLSESDDDSPVGSQSAGYAGSSSGEGETLF